MESFLDEMLVLLPLLGIAGFSTVEAIALTPVTPQPAAPSEPLAGLPPVTPSTPGTTPSTARPTYYLREKGRGIGAVPAEAEAIDDPRGFIVLAGAGPARDGGMSAGYLRLREQLRGDGTLFEEAGQVRLTRNYSFDSPSAAATIIVGSNRNGPATWKDHMNRTLAINRAANVESAT
jgi:hypothetical protein